MYNKAQKQGLYNKIHKWGLYNIIHIHGVVQQNLQMGVTQQNLQTWVVQQNPTKSARGGVGALHNKIRKQGLYNWIQKLELCNKV